MRSVVMAAFVVLTVSPMNHGIYAATVKRTVITVTTTSDPLPAPTNASACASSRYGRTLRCAILVADTVAHNVLIQFDIPDGNPGCQIIGLPTKLVSSCTIRPLSQLPPLTGDNLTINGFTQPGGRANRAQFGKAADGVYTLEMDGSGLGSLPGTTGLMIRGRGTAVRGISFVNWSNGAGLAVPACGGVSYVQGDEFGLSANGQIGPNQFGIKLHQSSQAHVCSSAARTTVMVGGSKTWERNVIVWSSTSGIDEQGDPTSRSVIGSLVVQGNYIGTTGIEPMPNAKGIWTTFGSGNHNTITGNVISGNATGISVSDSPITASANRIGVTADGKTPLANDVGISVSLEDHGPARIHNNVIAGNVGDGMKLFGAFDSKGNPTSQTVLVTDNSFGVSDQLLIPNGAFGIQVSTNGGGDTIEGNTIEGNGAGGVGISFLQDNQADLRLVPNPVYLARNSIVNNQGMAIDIAPFGHVTCDASSIPHAGSSLQGYQLVPCPMIRSWSSSIVSGTACGGCTVQVFLASSDSGDQQHGGASKFLGTTTADSNGSWKLSLSHGVFNPATQAITASASQRATGCSMCPTGTLTTSELATDEPAHAITVTSTGDSSVCPNGPGNRGYTLRCAIDRTDLGLGGQVISFDIPPGSSGCSATGECTISPSSPLPPLAASSTYIDGMGQPGSAPNVTGILGRGDDAILRIRVDGSGVKGPTSAGFTVLATSRVEGLSITGFRGPAIRINRKADDSQVDGDLLGVRPNGQPAGDSGAGVEVDHATNVQIGGPEMADRNVIGDNRIGVLVFGRNSTSASAKSRPDLVTIANNLIGTDMTGEIPRNNKSDGIDIRNGLQDVIGGPPYGNVVSGDSRDGINVNGSFDTLIANDIIGLNATEDQTLGNGRDGINIDDSTDSQIGWPAEGAAGQNIISGNHENGLAISRDNGDRVAGDVIGGGGPPNARLGNRGDGVLITNASAGINLSSSRLTGASTLVNTIVFNRLDGILAGASATDPDRVFVEDAKIYANGGLDFDLASPGAVRCTPSGNGPDGATHCPTITTANSTRIEGRACTACIVDVYRVVSPNKVHHGGSGQLLGQLKADVSGHWVLQLSLRLAIGSSITATATSGRGTSEMTRNVAVAAG